MSYETIGCIKGIPGLRDPVPLFALHVGASLARGNDSKITVVCKLRDGLVRRLMAIDHPLPRVPLILGKDQYILKNVILTSVAWSGKVSFYFDYAKELDPVIQNSKAAIYDRYSLAGPTSTF